MFLGGCGPQRPQPDDKATLQSGYRSLEAQQYNEAIAAADAYLARVPHGSGSAEALYLKGRGYEGRLAHSQSEAAGNLQSARNAYIQALTLSSSPTLESSIHTSLGNVAYFQDDYPTALGQWTVAYPRLRDSDVRAWVLYRIGICQQRMGSFDRADETFTNVQRTFPNTVPAQRSREHQGARAFYVQLATYSSPGGADKAAAALRAQGVTPVRVMDRQGNQQVRVGPVPTYMQALNLKGRFTSQYPDAIVIP